MNHLIVIDLFLFASQTIYNMSSKQVSRGPLADSIKTHCENSTNGGDEKSVFGVPGADIEERQMIAGRCSKNRRGYPSTDRSQYPTNQVVVQSQNQTSKYSLIYGQHGEENHYFSDLVVNHDPFGYFQQKQYSLP